MRNDSRLSSVLHVLLHMADSPKPLTSEVLAKYLQTNPVVVRRTLSGLREKGWIHSEKGHGGGWTLSADWKAITLGDIHRALGEPALFAIGHRSENPQCLVEQAVQQAMDGALQEAEALILGRFDAVTLGDLAADFGRRAEVHKGGHHHGQH